MTKLRAAIIMALIWLPFVAAADTQLLMAEEDGCIWCARFNAEIADAYPKTAEGKAAPLRRFDIHVGPPDGVTLKTRARFTPTFILVRDGVEIDRLEGYPGENFFWGILAVMLERSGILIEETG